MSPHTQYALTLLAFGFICLVVGLAAGYMLGKRPFPPLPIDSTGDAGDCTRPPGHIGPCNGYPVAGCVEFSDRGYPPPDKTAALTAALREQLNKAREGAGATTTEPNEVARRSAQAVFHSDGYPMPVRKAWGDIAYDELGPMFLDQFLLRYFPDLMKPEPYTLAAEVGISPWDAFSESNSWAKDMPLLFEQLTGYKLNEMQLNNAIAEYVRRLQKADAKKEHAKQQAEEQAANG